MDLFDFLGDPRAQLPIDRSAADDDCLKFCTKVLDDYGGVLDGLLESSPVVASEICIFNTIRSQRGAIQSFCRKLPEVIDLFYRGQLQKAYVSFASAIDGFRGTIDKQIIPHSNEHILLLFRIRESELPVIKKEDIFHIPFEKRHLVSTQRYSIPGLPCLYLGGSVYVCWLEMKQLPFYKLHISGFQPADGVSLQILDFSETTSRWKLRIPERARMFPEEDCERLIRFLILWPLIAMCSIRVKEARAPFKPEYIIPQLLLQWISTEKEFDGICYASTGVKHTVVESYSWHCNFVFPAREVKPVGRCKSLCEKFLVSTPINMQLLSAIGDNQSPHTNRVKEFKVEFSEGIYGKYYLSQFGQVELKLLDAITKQVQQTYGRPPDSLRVNDS